MCATDRVQQPEPQPEKEVNRPNGHTPHEPVPVVDVPESLAPQFSEDALAAKFTKKYGADMRFTAGMGRWFTWTGRVWKPDTTLQVYNRARTICRAESAYCHEVRLARKVASAATRSAVEQLARSDPRHVVEVDQWDSNIWLLNTPDGIVDLKTGDIRPARREDYCTKMTTIAPSVTAGCPQWLAFLNKVTKGDAALVGFLQRICGYALTGSIREEALFFLYGPGGNGKGTFLDTFVWVMGDYAQASAIETFIDTRGTRHPTELAKLQGARLVTAVETEKDRYWSESRLKMLTGGDVIPARYMRQDFFDFRPQFTLVIVGNHQPHFRTVNEAIRRRFYLVPFPVKIPDLERDEHLKEKLRGEGRGILHWCINGCLDWQEKGLAAPLVVRDATADYLHAEDNIQRWLDACCIQQPGQSTAFDGLWSSWCIWAEVAHVEAGSQTSFALALQERNMTRDRKTSGSYYWGVRLRPDAEWQRY
jgi:putative DNA primase/helicase